MVHILYKIPLVPYDQLLQGVDAAIILSVSAISATEDVDFSDIAVVTGVIDLSGSSDRLAAFSDGDVVTADAFVSADESYLLADTDTIISLAGFDSSDSIDAVDEGTLVSVVSAKADDALNSEFIDTTVIVTASINTSQEEFDGVDSASETAAASISSTDTHDTAPEVSSAIGAALHSAIDFATFSDNSAQVFGFSNVSAVELATWLDSATLVSTGQMSTIESRIYGPDAATLSGIAQITAIDSPSIALPVATASAISPAVGIDLSIISSVSAATASAPVPSVTYAFFDAAVFTSGDIPAAAPTEPSLAQLPQLGLVASDAGTDLYEAIDTSIVIGASVIITSFESLDNNIIVTSQGLPATAPTTPTLAQLPQLGLELTDQSVDLFD